MMGKYKLVFWIGLVFLAASCTSKNEGDIEPPNNACVTVGLRYSIDIKPIVDVSCANANCHSPAGGQLPFYDTRVGLINNEQKIRERINLPDGSPSKMPLGGSLSDCNIEKLEAWFDDGAPN